MLALTVMLSLGSSEVLAGVQGGIKHLDKHLGCKEVSACIAVTLSLGLSEGLAGYSLG